MRLARNLNLLKGVLERLLYRDIGVAASSALSALLGQVADHDIVRVV